MKNILLTFLISFFVISCASTKNPIKKTIFIDKVKITNVTSNRIEDFKLMNPKKGGFIASGYIMAQKKFLLLASKNYPMKDIFHLTITYKINDKFYSKILELKAPTEEKEKYDLLIYITDYKIHSKIE